MNLKRKVIVWDMDGPFNCNYVAPVKTDTASFYSLPDRQDLDRGDAPEDFTIHNLAFLKLTLELLHANNVESVIGSQRIQMLDTDPTWGVRPRAMYGGLDFFFGKERPYLSETLARKIGGPLQSSDTQNSKVPLLDAYQKEFQIPREDIILVDDDDCYKIPATDQGYQFVHAPRCAKSGSVEDNAYMYEALSRATSLQALYGCLEKVEASAEIKNEFKKQLIEYQLKHLSPVIDWQKQILSENTNQTTSATDLSSEQAAAKEVLDGLRYLILNTKWDIGLLGGVKIEDQAAGIKNTIPKGMNAVLVEIERAQGSQNWDGAVANIKSLIEQSAAKTDHHMFNKRGESTKQFYTHAKSVLGELRKQSTVEEKQPLSESTLDSPSNS